MIINIEIIDIYNYTVSAWLFYEVEAENLTISLLNPVLLCKKTEHEELLFAYI